MFMNTITICNTYMLYDIYIFMDMFSIEVATPKRQTPPVIDTKCCLL